jgi:hypothetical protein
MTRYLSKQKDGKRIVMHRPVRLVFFVRHRILSKDHASTNEMEAGVPGLGIPHVKGQFFCSQQSVA